MVKISKKIHKIRSRKFVQPNPGIRLIGGSPADFVRISGLDKNKRWIFIILEHFLPKITWIFNPHYWTLQIFAVGLNLEILFSLTLIFSTWDIIFCGRSVTKTHQFIWPHWKNRIDKKSLSTVLRTQPGIFIFSLDFPFHG